jgi:hypothetical protein
VGGPTEGHGASAPLKTALRSMALGSAAGVRVATFDTRFRMSRVLTGSAGVSAGKLLACVGARIVAGPESFFVTKGKPPALEPGEVERAAGWAVTVARSI